MAWPVCLPVSFDYQAKKCAAHVKPNSSVTRNLRSTAYNLYLHNAMPNMAQAAAMDHTLCGLLILCQYSTTGVYMHMTLSCKRRGSVWYSQ